MPTSRVQPILWIIFLIYYTHRKYFAALDVWDTEYAIQVAILIVMTAILPFYLMRLIVSRTEGRNQLLSTLILPTLLCAVGYALFYYTRVKPSFPDVTLAQVLPRSLLPGIAITALLFVPKAFKKPV